MPSSEACSLFPLAYDYFSCILKVMSLLVHQERCLPETPFEEVLMLLSQRVLCVVSSFLIITAAPPAFAKPKDKHSLPPRATAGSIISWS